MRTSDSHRVLCLVLSLTQHHKYQYNILRHKIYLKIIEYQQVTKPKTTIRIVIFAIQGGLIDIKTATFSSEFDPTPMLKNDFCPNPWGGMVVVESLILAYKTNNQNKPL